MKIPTRNLLAAGALATALLGTAGCTGATGTATVQDVQAATVVQTAFPGLPASTGNPHGRAWTT